MKQYNIYLQVPETIDYLYGTKAIGLEEMRQINLPVPDFFVVSGSSFFDFCNKIGISKPEKFYENCQYDDSPYKLLSQVVGDDIDIVFPHMSLVTTNKKFMVRSSSVPSSKTDLGTFPSAISGAFDSVLATDTTSISSALLTVWKSFFSEKAFNQCKVLSGQKLVDGMGVVIQTFVLPTFSGVLHTHNKGISINWVEGHLSKIVNGEVLGNSINVYTMRSGDYILRGIEDDVLRIKENKLEGVVCKLYDLSNEVMNHFGYNQEIEWAFDGENVWLLQTQDYIVDHKIT